MGLQAEGTGRPHYSWMCSELARPEPYLTEHANEKHSPSHSVFFNSLFFLQQETRSHKEFFCSHSTVVVLSYFAMYANLCIAYFLSVSLSLSNSCSSERKKKKKKLPCSHSSVSFTCYDFQTFKTSLLYLYNIFWVSSRSHSTVLSLACYTNVANIGLFYNNVYFSLGEFRLCFVPIKGTVGRGRYCGLFQTKVSYWIPLRRVLPQGH